MDFELSDGELERTKDLCERLLDQPKHLKLYLIYANLEASAMGETDLPEQKKQCVLNTRSK